MNYDGILPAQIPLQLTHSLNIWQRFDISDCSANFSDHDVVIICLARI